MVENLPEQSASRRVAAENLAKLLVVERRKGGLAGLSWCGAARCDWSKRWSARYAYMHFMCTAGGALAIVRIYHAVGAGLGA